MRHDVFIAQAPARTVEHEVYGPTGMHIEAMPMWDRTPEGAALRLMRQVKGVTLMRAAAEAGILAYDWSRLEQGRVVPEDPGLWVILRAAVVTAERYDREGGAL